MTTIEIAEHPLLDLHAFVTEFDRPLAGIPVSEELLDLMRQCGEAPFHANDADRLAVRDLLRQGGFKPTGRSKPASEYLLKAQAEGKPGNINLAVDACNVVSLHSGLPISVVDLDLLYTVRELPSAVWELPSAVRGSPDPAPRAVRGSPDPSAVRGSPDPAPPASLRVAIADTGTSYIFNQSGQSIDIGGLLCLFDAQGPCANGVKDSQRTKTSDGTRRTLSLIWGTKAIPGRCEQVAAWYHRLLANQARRIEVVWPVSTRPSYSDVI